MAVEKSLKAKTRLYLNDNVHSRMVMEMTWIMKRISETLRTAQSIIKNIPLTAESRTRAQRHINSASRLKQHQIRYLRNSPLYASESMSTTLVATADLVLVSGGGNPRIWRWVRWKLWMAVGQTAIHALLLGMRLLWGVWRWDERFEK